MILKVGNMIRDSDGLKCKSVLLRYVFFFFKQKTAYEITV